MFPLLGAAPRSAGGLGYSPGEIGIVFGAAGIVVIAAQLLLYPQLTKLGLRSSSMLICALQIPFQVALPLCGSIADDTLRDYVVMAVVCTKCAFVSIHPLSSVLTSQLAQLSAHISAHQINRRAASLCQIEMFCTSGALMMNNAVTASRRAGLTGFSSTVCGPMRVLGPAVTSPIFAWSLIQGAEIGFPFDRSLIFLTFGAAELLALYTCWSMPAAIDRPAARD
jgi:hypothetical protein